MVRTYLNDIQDKSSQLLKLYEDEDGYVASPLPSRSSSE